MGSKTKKAANGKKKHRATEATESNGALLTERLPAHEEIQHRAYEIYLSQGAADGRDLENWLQAERGLREASGNAASE